MMTIADLAKKLKHPNIQALRRHLVKLDQMSGGGILVGGGTRGSNFYVNWGRLRTSAPHLFDLPAEIDGIRRKVDLCVEVGEELKGQNMAISKRIRALHARINDQDKAIERLARSRR